MSVQMKLQHEYSVIKQDLNSIASKVGELEMEKEEHQLVMGIIIICNIHQDTISPLDPARKCFRLVGGVLVERQVQDVLPAIKSNLVGIDQILKQLVYTYKKKETELVDFTTKNNVQIKQ